MSARYEYLTVELKRGRESWRAFAEHMRGAGNGAIENAGATLLGLFAPQLGFASNEAVVLTRRTGPQASRAAGAIAGAPGVARVTAEALSSTLRPANDARLKSGSGIYVHRWFTVDGDRLDDVIAYSGRAWPDFEANYDTEVFGLFTADASEADRREGSARLLLLTWYANHTVWEQSREHRDPGGLFAKRHELTRTTIARSSVRVA